VAIQYMLLSGVGRPCRWGSPAQARRDALARLDQSRSGKSGHWSGRRPRSTLDDRIRTREHDGRIPVRVADHERRSAVGATYLNNLHGVVGVAGRPASWLVELRCAGRIGSLRRVVGARDTRTSRCVPTAPLGQVSPSAPTWRKDLRTDDLLALHRAVMAIWLTPAATIAPRQGDLRPRLLSARRL